MVITGGTRLNPGDLSMSKMRAVLKPEIQEPANARFFVSPNV